MNLTKSFWKNHIVQVTALLFVIGFIAYSNTLSGPILWDGQLQIINSENIHEISSFADISLWTDVNFRPLAKFSFALNWMLDGESPVWYRVVNILLHILTSFIAYWLLRLTFSLLNNKKYDQRMMHATALVLSLLFLLHPLQTMAVTYVVQRMTLMAAFFYMAAVFLYAKGRIAYLHNEQKRRSVLLISLAILLGILGLMSKQNAVTFPMAFILYEIFFIRRKDGKMCKKYVYSALTMFFIVFLGVLFSGILPSETVSYTRLEYFVGQLGVLTRYLTLLVFPVGQNIDHFILLNDTLLGIREVTGIIILTGMITLAILSFKKNKLLSFGIFWFLLCMSIESGIIPIRDLMMEHRMYLPLFGISMCLAGVMLRYVHYKAFSSFVVTALLILIVLGVLTFQRNRVWASEISLWENSLQQNPGNPRAMLNLGDALTDRARVANTEQQKEKDLRLAISYFSEGIKEDTLLSHAYKHRALAYLELGEYNRALSDIEKVVVKKRKEEYLYLYVKGVIYAKLSQFSEALNSFNRAIAMNDSFSKLYTWRGLVLAETSDYNGALEDYLRSIELDPSQKILYVNISQMYFNTRKLVQAKKWANKALDAGLQFDPQYLEVLGISK